MTENRGDLTRLLERWQAGDEEAREVLFSRVLEDLHQAARGRRRQERKDHTLETSDLVNEVYLRLAEREELTFESRSHFFGLVASILRALLVDHSRRRKAQKRGGEELELVPLLDGFDLQLPAGVSAEQLLDLDRAIGRLRASNPSLYDIVNQRLLLGFSPEATAENMGISRATVVRRYRVARRWLARELSRATDEVPDDDEH